jgi:thiopeptide-type bacteriocin biosynthesis protein
VETLQQAFHRYITDKALTGVIQEYSKDTYQRELERYSEQLIEDVELLFYRSSELVVADLKDDAAEEDRDIRVLTTVHRMCRCFLPGAKERAVFFTGMKDLFLSEFQAGNQLIRDLDLNYRKLAKTLPAQIEETVAINTPATDAFFAQLCHVAKLSGDWPEPKRNALLADLVHMHVNRAFSSRQRQHEGVIYYHLSKYEWSSLARMTKKQVDKI